MPWAGVATALGACLESRAWGWEGRGHSLTMKVTRLNRMMGTGIWGRRWYLHDGTLGAVERSQHRFLEKPGKPPSLLMSRCKCLPYQARHCPVLPTPHHSPILEPMQSRREPLPALNQLPPLLRPEG